MSPLEVWYAPGCENHVDAAPDEKVRKFREQLANEPASVLSRTSSPRSRRQVGGRRRLVDQPPLLFHVGDPGFEERVREALADYRQSLSDERRVLLDRYHLEDFALKVVGIGSVGTRCFIGLFFYEEDIP